LGQQVKYLANRNADVIALQEVLARTAPLFRKAFLELGFAHSFSSFDLAPD
jgi:exonuclease III